MWSALVPNCSNSVQYSKHRYVSHSWRSRGTKSITVRRSGRDGWTGTPGGGVALARRRRLPYRRRTRGQSARDPGGAGRSGAADKDEEEKRWNWKKGLETDSSRQSAMSHQDDDTAARWLEQILGDDHNERRRSHGCTRGNDPKIWGWVGHNAPLPGLHIWIIVTVKPKLAWQFLFESNEHVYHFSPKAYSTS